MVSRSSFASCLEQTDIEVLDLRNNYNMSCNSPIKSLYLTCEGFFGLDSEQWQHFLSTIENMNLEYLNLDFGQDYREMHRHFQRWEMLENSIKASRLTGLN